MKLFKLSALSVSLLALATLSSSAFAQTVISDSFDASSGPANNSINGIAPTGANLPGAIGVLVGTLTSTRFRT